MAGGLVSGMATIRPERFKRQHGPSLLHFRAVVRARVAYMLFLAPAIICAAQAPTRWFSTYLGLADCDGIAGWKGDIFLACHSTHNQLPVEVEGPSRRESPGDAYVVRLNPASGKLVFATRIGGSAYSAAFRIKVDLHGFAYAVGVTRARDFPTTTDAVQRSFGGGQSDAFLVKVAPDGQLVYATFLGGGGAEEGKGLELDDGGGVFVAGTTWSTDFPGQQTAHPAVQGDAFVSYFQPGSPTSLRSVVFGGNQEEKLSGIALDRRGGLFAVGSTKSKNFPLVQPVQAGLRGASDLFLTRLETRDLHPTFSTFFGGSGDDSGWGVAVDHQGNPVVAGITNSGDLPASRDAFQAKPQGGLDAFVAQFRGIGYRDILATYFGGTKDDSSGYDGDDVKVDSSGNVWLVGFTESPNLPTKNALLPMPALGETSGFLAIFSSSLTKLCFATYDGGSGGEQLEGLDLSGAGSVLATGFSFAKTLAPQALVDQTKRASMLNGEEVRARVIGLRATNPCR